MSYQDKMNELSGRLGLMATPTRNVIVTAESCTGGMVSESLTSVAGSSAWFECAFVVYTPEAKIKFLDVRPELIDEYGVVSEPVASAMAAGALANSITGTLAVSLTGVAGPGGGTEKTPVGTVCIGWAERYNEHVITYARTVRLEGNRDTVRKAATIVALQGLIAMIDHKNPLTVEVEL